MSTVSARMTLIKSGITSMPITPLTFSISRSSTRPTFPQECPIARSNRYLLARSAMLAVILQVAVSAQTGPEHVAANLCDVFLSPAAYNLKEVSVEGVLSPSFHSLFLSSPSCRHKEGLDLTTEAILPPSWDSLPNGKHLRKFLHR